jgi:RNA polymerase sigma factor for flagellar operon FliA
MSMAIGVETYRSAVQDQQRDEMVVAHLPLVRHILGRLVASLPGGVDVESLESAGILGLVEASLQFDSTRGVPFKSFAYPRIRGAILDELRRNCPLPQHMLQAVAKVRSAAEVLEPPVTPELLAEHTGMTVDEVAACLEAIRLTRPCQWDESLERGLARRDGLGDPQAEVEHRESRELLAECVTRLPEQERLVLTLYYLEDLRLKEIGRVIGLSESRVSRILSKAELRLREYVQERSV